MTTYHIMKHVNITNMIIGPLFWGGGVVFKHLHLARQRRDLFRQRRHLGKKQREAIVVHRPRVHHGERELELVRLV